MNNPYLNQLQLLPVAELNKRLARMRDLMTASGLDAILVSSNANIYYLTGRVYCGYVFVPLNGQPVYAVRRPSTLVDPTAIVIHKIEDLPAQLNLVDGMTIGLEMGTESYSSICRIEKAFGDAARFANASSVIASARAVKTDFELAKIKESGIKQTALYEHIPRLFEIGMRDIDLQIAIETLARREGCLGQFRIGGSDMELFMGNILVGDNADTPSPYDFAMGGAGLDPSLPVGADGTLIEKGASVMVDFNGNFTGYMTDMTRCFTLDKSSLPEKALHAHRTSIAICETLADMGRPGVEAKAMYEKAYAMAVDAGLERHFMGNTQHAGFVGHGLGIEINELPVIAPRSRSVLEVGNVIALEPKFVIPGVGALGIENTYVVRPEGPMECLTNAPQQIISFE